MHVIKRNGETVPYDIEKVRNVIRWAGEDLDINPLELESKIDIVIQEGMDTRDIQKNLIAHAATLTSSENPDWKYVAGRLLIMSLWKQLGKNPKERANNYVSFVYNMVAERKYDDKLIVHYNEEELHEAGAYINPDRDLDFDYAGAIKLKRSYLIEGESPQEAFMSMALLLAIPEAKENRLKYAKEFYDIISQRKLSLATPFLGNLRIPDGNVSSCFIVGMDDSLDSITETWAKIAQISKNGGGIGVNLSRIRSKGATIKNVKNASSGIIPSIKVINDIAVYINQLGRRAGAITVSIDNWHRDLDAFLELQTENGDLRTKAFDIQPQLVVSDLFMERDEEDSIWTLFDPHEVKGVMGFDLAEAWGDDFRAKYIACENAAEEGKLKLVDEVPAREIMKKIISNYIETGLPYIAFKDTINEVNPNNHEGYIPSVNLCVESFSNVKPGEEAHTCNLNSINLANIDSADDLDHVASRAVRILDNAIDLTEAPIADSAFHNLKYRTIGVGTMGLADWIAKEGYSYDNGLEAIDNLYERFALATVKESIKLAKERGPFMAFEGSMWDTGERISIYKEKATFKDEWNHLAMDLMKYGIRNSQITAIAPNTSTSLVQGCTASIWPVYSKFYFDNNSSGAVPITPPYIKDRFWSYKEYKHMDSIKMNDIVSTIQHWIDTGISYEPMFDLNKEHIDAKYIYDFIKDAWRKKIKTIYYVRLIQKDSSMRTGDSCESCAG